MWPSESDLEPLDSIIDRMNPISGFPYPMKSAMNPGFPRNVGDPWIGAYTKNGFWFKLAWGGEEEWKEAANEMWYRNDILVDSDTFQLYEKAAPVKFLVAKNIRGEVLGLALLSTSDPSNFSIIGLIFVQEDFRHVGIGCILMKEIMKENTEIAFNSISYLFPRIEEKFKLSPKSMRTFGRIRVTNPSGFPNLKEEKAGVILSFAKKISDEQWDKISEFGESCTNEKRNWRPFADDKNQLVAAFDKDSGDCLGISVLREIENEDGRIPDLLVAPLYANFPIIAEILLRKTFKKHYNPEDDYDFDVDHFAIYRRSVNFFVFSSSESFMIPLLKKLSGSDGKVEKDRLTFQTCSNFQLPAINHDLIFSLSDPNIHLC
ncbi:unnamed protein product [Caenorhabditis nigoni]